MQFIGTVTASGVIKAYNEECKTYDILTDKGINYVVEENEITFSEREKKIKELSDKITTQKLRIADCSIKIRDALWDDHPAHIGESRKEYDKLNEEWFDLISEYDDLEDEYIILTKEQ